MSFLIHAFLAITVKNLFGANITVLLDKRGDFIVKYLS